jgi:hypothetical protein
MARDWQPWRVTRAATFATGGRGTAGRAAAVLDRRLLGSELALAARAAVTAREYAALSQALPACWPRLSMRD